MKKFARTVLGDIDPSQLGIVDCHDHLIKNYGPEAHEHPDLLWCQKMLQLKKWMNM